MNELASQLRAISLHESGHATVALALRLPVVSIRMSVTFGGVRGETAVRFLPFTKRSHSVAVFLAGVLAVNAFTHVKLFVSDPDVVSRPPRTLADRHEARAVRRYRFDKTAAASGSDLDGDLGAVRELLRGCKHPNRIFNRAETIARRCLDANERVVRAIAQQLLWDGHVSGGTLGRLARDVKLYESM